MAVYLHYGGLGRGGYFMLVHDLHAMFAIVAPELMLRDARCIVYYSRMPSGAGRSVLCSSSVTPAARAMLQHGLLHAS